MSIEIILSPSLQPLAGNAPSVNVEGKTLGECLDALMQKHPQLKDALLDDNRVLRKDYMIFINGENAYVEEISRPVKEGDKIHLMTFFVGG
jgi:molybdopterin converting factor small subunit